MSRIDTNITSYEGAAPDTRHYECDGRFFATVMRRSNDPGGVVVAFRGSPTVPGEKFLPTQFVEEVFLPQLLERAAEWYAARG